MNSHTETYVEKVKNVDEFLNCTPWPWRSRGKTWKIGLFCGIFVCRR